MNEMIPTPRNRKPWIRRHKILAVVAPFVALILFLSAWMGIRGACVPSAFEPDSSPWNRFLSNAMDGFLFSVFSWMVFLEDWARLTRHYWLAYPLYVVPVIVFISTMPEPASFAFPTALLRIWTMGSPMPRR